MESTVKEGCGGTFKKGPRRMGEVSDLSLRFPAEEKYGKLSRIWGTLQNQIYGGDRQAKQWRLLVKAIDM